MIVWRDILKPLPQKINRNITIGDALSFFEEFNTSIYFIYNNEEIIGYIDLNSILIQLVEKKSLDVEIEFKEDILSVHYDTPVEFYFNCSVYLGFMEDNIIGYITQNEATNRLNELRLYQLNESLDSAEVGIITMDKACNVTFMNGTAEDIIGLSRTFLLNRNYRELVKMDADISMILDGQQLMNIKSYFNFKVMNGHLSPIFQKGKIIGIVHIFQLQKQLEETAKELEFVKELNEDLKAIYSASNEQILVIHSNGEIIRLAGTYLTSFWDPLSKENIIGSNIYRLEEEQIFTPNIFDICLKKKKKTSLVQHAKNGMRIWSTAMPIYENNQLRKVIVVSRDITSFDKMANDNKLRGGDNQQDKEDEQTKTLIYRSKVMSIVVSEINHIAQVDSTVLLFGESGVGKEVLAQYIHNKSHRRGQSIVSVNCGAIPDNLLEAELFGYEKGAFTGAVQTKKGLFEVANGGTLFLDEITELPLHMQVKLLRALQEREIVRVGGINTIKVDVRVIAATNNDIEKMVKEQKFREDLYYRINVIPITIPPLRERKEDIVSLSIHFLHQINYSYKKNKTLSRDALLLLESYRWPGNVRELQNVIERLAVTTQVDMITQENVFQVLYHKQNKSAENRVVVRDIIPMKEAIKDLESQLIMLAINKYGTAAEAAKVLDVSPATISRRVNSLLK